MKAECVSMWGANPTPGRYSFTVSWSRCGRSGRPCRRCRIGAVAGGKGCTGSLTLRVCRVRSTSDQRMGRELSIKGAIPWCCGPV